MVRVNVCCCCVPMGKFVNVIIDLATLFVQLNVYACNEYDEHNILTGALTLVRTKLKSTAKNKRQNEV